MSGHSRSNYSRRCIRRGSVVPVTTPARATPSRTSAGDVTRARIVEAALQTIREEGVVGTSARAIARAGGFNQALIFYHFGSVQDVLLAAVERISEARMARYQERL